MESLSLYSIPSFFIFIMAEERSLKTELDNISTRCWRTARARFDASRRMRRCSNASSLCVAMLSLEIIVINLLIYIPSLNLDTNLVTILTVCLSAFVLVLSLIISQLKYDRKEEEYHQCGILLAALEKRVNIFAASKSEYTHDEVKEFNDEYQKILRESNLNHAEIDWEHALRNEKHNYKDKKEEKESTPSTFLTFWLWVRWTLLRSDSIYNLLTFLGIGVIVLVICFGRINRQNLNSDSNTEMIINIYNSK